MGAVARRGRSLSYYYFMVASSYAYYNHKYAPMEPKSARATKSDWSGK